MSISDQSDRSQFHWNVSPTPMVTPRLIDRLLSRLMSIIDTSGNCMLIDMDSKEPREDIANFKKTDVWDVVWATVDRTPCSNVCHCALLADRICRIRSP